VDVLLRRAEALIEVRRAAEAAPMLGQHLAEHPDSFRAWAAATPAASRSSPLLRGSSGKGAAGSDYFGEVAAKAPPEATTSGK
jgi:hypothetical protein